MDIIHLREYTLSHKGIWLIDQHNFFLLYPFNPFRAEEGWKSIPQFAEHISNLP
jgi:hypothetical protein